MAPKPPAARSAPAQPWHSSIFRLPLGRWGDDVLVAVAPGDEARVLEDATDFVMYQEPARLAAVLADFAKRIPV